MDQRKKFFRYPTRTEKKKNIKSCGKFLYYGQEVDPMLLVALLSITADPAKGTTQTEGTVHQF